MRAVSSERMPCGAGRGVHADLDLLFPIRDAASARFMQFKAHCLLRVGIITRAEKAQVDAAAARALMQAVKEGCGAQKRVA